MPYVTSIERIRTKREMKKVQQETIREDIATLLKTRFGRKGRDLLAEIDLPEEISRLRRLFRSLIQADDLAAAARVIEQGGRARRAT
jgi:hypothetical protein